MRQILFITSGSIGDAIISTGLLAYLLDKHPQAEFTIASGPAAAPLFEAFPRLKQLITIRKQEWNRHWLTLWNAVRVTQWDLVVDLRGSLLSFLISTHARKIFHSADKTKSKAEQLAALFDLSQPPPTRLWSSDAARMNAKALVPQTPYIVIAPKTASAAKDWPIERFAALANRLCKDNRNFVILASAAQKESVQPLVTSLPASQVIDLSGRTDLLTAYAVLEGAQLFIGNDSGLFHMSSAAAIPSLGIYGPSNDKIYAPRGPHVHIVKSHDFALGEEEKRDNRYMQMISVEMVEEATRNLMNNRNE